MANPSEELTDNQMLANISTIADYLKYKVKELKLESEIESWKDELRTKREDFLVNYSIEKLTALKALPKDELKKRLFGTKDDDSFAYRLSDYPGYRFFGSAKMANSNSVITPSKRTKNPGSFIPWDGKEFIEYLEAIDSYINSKDSISSEKDYKDLWELLDSYSPNYYTERIWVKKYLHILYPEVFGAQYAEKYQKAILNGFRIIPSKQEYVNAFQLSKLSKETGIPTDYYEDLAKKLKIDKFDSDEPDVPKQEGKTTNKEVRKMTELYKTNYTKPEKYSFNCIFFGAPGTGKSHELEDQRKELLEEELLGEEVVRNQYERVTFHPDYSYANFVGTYKPVPVEQNGEETISYRYVPGPFMRILVKALINSAKSKLEDVKTKPYLLIIEEINRANVAAVFGDVFQLLDRKEGMSEYEIHLSEDMKNYIQKSFDEAGIQLKDSDTIKLPNNLFIWATMNSADQGVFPMDTAFKRRWDFEYIGIDDGEAGKDGKDGILDYTFTLGKGGSEREVNWNQLRKAINNYLSEEGINEDKLMGPYFISPEKLGDAEVFINAFKNKVLMYLFDDAAKHKRSKVFSEGINSNIYSKICEEFDKKGVFVFANEISSQFKEPNEKQPVDNKPQADNSPETPAEGN